MPTTKDQGDTKLTKKALTALTDKMNRLCFAGGVKKAHIQHNIATGEGGGQRQVQLRKMSPSTLGPNATNEYECNWCPNTMSFRPGAYNDSYIMIAPRDNNDPYPENPEDGFINVCPICAVKEQFSLTRRMAEPSRGNARNPHYLWDNFWAMHAYKTHRAGTGTGPDAILAELEGITEVDGQHRYRVPNTEVYLPQPEALTEEQRKSAEQWINSEEVKRHREFLSTQPERPNNNSQRNDTEPEVGESAPVRNTLTISQEISDEINTILGMDISDDRA